MDNKYTNLTYEGSLAILEINAPPANALSSACINELREVIAELDNNEDVFAVIITGHGRFFVAGADIKEFIPAMGNDQRGLEMAKAGQALCDEIESMRKPVIAAINGPALGGGLELAMGCHIRIASDEAILGLPELNLGLIPTFGGTQRLSRLTGVSTAVDLILSGKQLSAKEAVSYGIVKEVVSKDELMFRAGAIANSYIKNKSMQAISRTVQAIVKGNNETIDSGLKRERELFAELFLTHDAKEGVEAFSEKRSPNFKHS
ncbi:enoyl-CoA hydratase-related protein [Virgibacillus alimentarius]|uniref:Enoyl-CoA hydratase n=1 Tax=Virgibacillus alimentarius TaxID=698769 RepID=A0ABS4S770_9BACI|nr:enoyl-CoA hydratase-related protein [Virgibacillus alimentarius]MBP2257336.1 enoyl-CoA hydratase [Virgibacillus alimentarius]